MLGKILQRRYHIVQILGAGGFCQTYIARDVSRPDYPKCVVKHLKPISNYFTSLQTLRQLFLKEAEALEKLGNHEQVPRLIAHFEEDQEFYLVVDFIAGHPLSAEMQPGQCWSETQVVQMLQDVLRILDFVHSHRLIHRDIKPSNLIRRQQDGRLVLIDFGSVKQIWSQVITEGRTSGTTTIGIPATIAIGTPGYMPIEQARGRPRPNSDLYALGMMGIQALTGLSPMRLPEDSETGEFIWQHQTQASAELIAILNKMVCYYFKDRYQSATEVMQALQQLAPLCPRSQLATGAAQHLVQSAAPTQQLVVAEPMSQVALSPESETIRFTWDDGVQLHVGSQLDDAIWSDRSELPGSRITDASAPSASTITLLVGVGIGVISVLVLTVVSYFTLELYAPVSPAQQVEPLSSRK